MPAEGGVTLGHVLLIPTSDLTLPDAWDERELTGSPLAFSDVPGLAYTPADVDEDGLWYSDVADAYICHTTSSGPMGELRCAADEEGLLAVTAPASVVLRDGDGPSLEAEVVSGQVPEDARPLLYTTFVQAADRIGATTMVLRQSHGVCADEPSGCEELVVGTDDIDTDVLEALVDFDPAADLVAAEVGACETQDVSYRYTVALPDGRYAAFDSCTVDLSRSGHLGPALTAAYGG